MALAPPSAVRRSPLAALFLVSAGTVGTEIALTRFFAVAKWSEYGYWVISIVLAGFAVSGVALALARPFFQRHAGLLLAWLPAALVASGGLGYWFASGNPFNPLQLQNNVTLLPQLWLIGGYYAALLPFFALAGLFIGLCFVVDSDRVGLVYGTDLSGAGFGSVLALALMAVAHPFRLVAWLLLPLAAAAWWVPHRARAVPAALVALLAAEALLVWADRAHVDDFKAIYAPLHVPDSRVLAEWPTPHGLYDLLEDFTEHLDADVSNNAGMLGLPGPPEALGLYRDGNRIAGLPKGGAAQAAYAPATLAALPYTLLTAPPVLLVGASGGFRLAEAAVLGATDIDAVEPEPVLRSAIHEGLGGAPKLALGPGRRLLAGPAMAVAASRRYDLIDIAGDFAEAAEANGASLSAEALAVYLRSLTPQGLLSVPVSIREFPAYATRMLATVRRAALVAGIADPARHVVVYRSAWNLRILVGRTPFGPERLAAVRAWCDARSFDVSFAPGQTRTAPADIYNDLPAVSFADAAVTSGEGPHDAVADEAGIALAGGRPDSARSFDLSPVTLDRPTLNAVLRLGELPTILRRLELLPQGEVAPLVNVAVLAQAAVIALLVLAVPLLAGVRVAARGGLPRIALYFAALGLGYLMIEIAGIEGAAILLGDRTWAFALVLTAMLISSGVGSLLAGRRGPRALRWAIGAVLGWCVLMLVLLPQPGGQGGAALLATAMAWPFAWRAGLIVVVVAPVALALGMPFPLGLAQLGPTQSQAAAQGSGAALPWAWALNGAFSVVGTPLANLIAIEFGHARVLEAALVVYASCLLTFPRSRIVSCPSAPRFPAVS